MDVWPCGKMRMVQWEQERYGRPRRSYFQRAGIPQTTQNEISMEGIALSEGMASAPRFTMLVY